ncbi:MAG: hypothetical protein IPH50_14940 [Rhodanobacteraceae bacterium]|nr:hypothetical protein [Rhodanobacteraceae bacterium]
MVAALEPGRQRSTYCSWWLIAGTRAGIARLALRRQSAARQPVQGAAYPELGAEQFALGISTYYTWMARFFYVVVTTEEQLGAVLRVLLDFLAEGLGLFDFADLKAMLHHVGTCALHRRAFATNDQVESAA